MRESNTRSIVCSECGADHEIVQGDLLVTVEPDDWVFVSEIADTGVSEVGQGEDIPSALRDAADHFEAREADNAL